MSRSRPLKKWSYLTANVKYDERQHVPKCATREAASQRQNHNAKQIELMAHRNQSA